jgi:hypothetical protein
MAALYCVENANELVFVPGAYWKLICTVTETDWPGTTVIGAGEEPVPVKYAPVN